MTRQKLIFTIYGDLLDPQLFSEITKLSPTTSWKKGDAIQYRKQGLIRKQTCWEYSFDFIQTLFFEDLANLFYQRFSPNIEGIVEYIRKNSLETKVYLVVEIVNNEIPALFFNKMFMDLVVKMNGEIDIDLYNINE